jgi:hypothetical protein
MKSEQMATEKHKKPQENGIIPQWSRQFCYWINL